MKLAIVLAAALLVASLAAAAPPTSSPASACGLQLATPAAAAAPALAFLPAPQPATLVVCRGCSSPLCDGRPLGSVCGVSTTTHCVAGPSCTTGGVTCICK